MATKVYDFRSDTVTVPTSEMLAALCASVVGDDVKNEDPTVHKLQVSL
jgi:threonine aldolase